MTTYQMVSEKTGATLALVKSVSKSIIGNRHKITTSELNQIIAECEKRVKENDSITKSTQYQAD